MHVTTDASMLVLLFVLIYLCMLVLLSMLILLCMSIPQEGAGPMANKAMT